MRDRLAQRIIAARIGPRDLLLTGGIEPAEPPPGDRGGGI